MNKSELVAAVAAAAEVSKAEAQKYVNTVIGAIADNLTEGDGEVALPDFGRFVRKTVPARSGVNPRTKERITIEEHEKVVFKPSDNMSIYSRKHS